MSPSLLRCPGRINACVVFSCTVTVTELYIYYQKRQQQKEKEKQNRSGTKVQSMATKESLHNDNKKQRHSDKVLL